MWFDDAVETFKRHAQNEKSAGHRKSNEWDEKYGTSPEGIIKNIQIVSLSHERNKTCNRILQIHAITNYIFQ